MRYVSTLDSVNYLKFYLLDIYCPDFIRKSSIIKIPNDSFNVELDKAKIPRRSTKTLSIRRTKKEYRFIDETAETVCRN